MSRELGRVLRWRHASFRRRRLPFVWETYRLFSWRGVSFPFRDPRMWWFSVRVRLHYAIGTPLPLTDTQKGVRRF